MNTVPSNTRPARKISYKEQQSVDEILKLVQDQTRKISLSGADYRTQKRMEHSPSIQTEDDTNDFFDDSTYSTSTTSSELSYTPPSTQQTVFSWESNATNNQGRLSSGDLSGGKLHRSLPPLEPMKTTKLQPLRPPGRLASHDSFDNDDLVQLKRPARPMSARGQRTQPRSRGLTT